MEGTMARDTDIARREERGLARPGLYRNPVSMLERFADEMDRLFDDFGLGRGLMAPRQTRGWLDTPAARATWNWVPDVEVFHRNSELVVRADLPGLTKDEVKVDVTEDRVTIQGERKREREEEHEGVYRSERSYGRFCRDIPLPPGTISDQAKASFHDGVLEITMPAPPESARRGRRLEISEAPIASRTPAGKK
jgi:HSP20 family protein